MAAQFGARIDQFEVRILNDQVLFQGAGEAWPTRAGVELVLRGEQGFAAGNIDIDALPLFVPE